MHVACAVVDRAPCDVWPAGGEAWQRSFCGHAVTTSPSLAWKQSLWAASMHTDSAVEVPALPRPALWSVSGGGVGRGEALWFLHRQRWRWTGLQQEGCTHASKCAPRTEELRYGMQRSNKTCPGNRRWACGAQAPQLHASVQRAAPRTRINYTGQETHSQHQPASKSSTRGGKQAGARVG